MKTYSVRFKGCKKGRTVGADNPEEAAIIAADIQKEKGLLSIVESVEETVLIPFTAVRENGQ
jgi:hypothetical protein